MHILVTGGAGYIGSHTVLALLTAGYQVTVVDNLDNSSRESLKRVQAISRETLEFHAIDVRNKAAMEQLFADNNFDGVIHFAGLKAVGESVAEPARYYDNNVGSTLVLCELIVKYHVPHFVFSSSATVYGRQPIPYTEATGRTPENPYGNTKYICELLMEDVANAPAAAELSFVALRYFNPVGAHPSGMIGEDPKGVPNNLMPYVAQVASGKRTELQVFGNDYDTVDGTGVRDYIHVVDLARGHVAALKNSSSHGFQVYNLGTGTGQSVLQLIHAFEKASGKPIPYNVTARRAGDLAEYYADATKAAQELNWKAELSLEDACRDSWNWQSKNPNGYDA